MNYKTSRSASSEVNTHLLSATLCTTDILDNQAFLLCEATTVLIVLNFFFF